jgi:hypothetical protein
MTALACPVCGTEYEGWSTRCLNCGVALTPTEDPPNPLQLDEEDQVVYELGEWPLDLQAAAAQALAEADIPNAWDGTDLIVHVDHEAQVDAILEAIEQAGGLTEAATGEPDEISAEASDEEIDEEGDGLLEYTLDELRPDERVRLTQLLEENGLRYRWEDDVTLLVDDTDEALVEALLDQVEYPNELPEEPAEEEVAGEGDPEALGSLFVAADKLKHNPLDAGAYGDLLALLESCDEEAPPYGFPKPVWLQALTSADQLADLIAEEEDRTPEASEKASELRELLRPYV